MAPKHKKDTEDAIDKRRVRRPRVVLRTLPPIVFSTPNNIVTLQLTMSASGVKAQPSSAPSSRPRASYEGDFGVNKPLDFAHLKYVEQSFDLVQKNIGEVAGGLSEARQALGEKIDGLERHLTTKIDDQTTSTDKRFKALDEAIDDKLKKQTLDVDMNLANRIDPINRSIKTADQWMTKHKEQTNKNFRAVDERFDKMQESVDERFNKVDERFNKVDERFNKVDERLDSLETGMKRIEQLLQHLLAQSGAPPIAFPSPPQASSPSSSRPLLTVSPPTSPVAGPSTPRSRSRNPSSAARDAEAMNSPESNREPNRDPVLEVFRTIRRQASRGVGLVTKGKERSDQ